MTVTRRERLRIRLLVAALNVRLIGAGMRRWWEDGCWRQLMIGAAVVAGVEVLLLWRALQAITERWS